ncbi:GntR family transcriptional regulator [Sporolactobacillus shoreae]|nr:GntR family transcriptional regulator [Sporolactobacillus shoreae]
MVKYKEVAEDIQKRIYANEFNGKLPTEQALIEMYDVSRNTIRSAINILVKRGSIHKVQGSGLYINRKTTDDKTIINLSVKIGLTRLLPKSTITSEVLDFHIFPADAAMAQEFNCDPETLIYRVKRLRMIDGKPLAIENSYYNKDIVKYLDKNIVKNSIYSYIENDLKMDIRFSDEYISMKRLSDEECHLLNLNQGSSCLMIKEINFLRNSAIFNVSETLYNSDHIALYAPVQRD